MSDSYRSPLRLLRQAVRLAYINFVLVRHGLDEVVFAIHLLRPLRFLLLLMPWHWFRDLDVSRGERIRRALEDLGPIFIKFGQMLSTRRDLLPDDIAVELARLQDRVPPFEGARAVIERAYGRPVTELFQRFEEQPIASASIAQVHGAVLHDGREVVVKVVRPEIERTIRRDLDLLHVVAELAQRYWPEGRRLRPREVVDEYEKTIIDELDLYREAANASQLRRNFEGSRELYVPEIHWDFVRRNVLVMERIHGIPVAEIGRLRAAGVDLKLLAERGVEIFFTQVFRHNFFHADMHPGNIFVDRNRPDDPRYLAIDFGIVGSLAPEDQRYLAENFYAFFNRDYRRVAELHVESGWVPGTTRINEFESAIRTVCEPIFERPLKDISFGHVLLRLFQTARRFDMQVQPQLVLLQKTLLNIEGIGRQLYPELDLWKTAKPFIERWMHEQMGALAFLRKTRQHLPKLFEQLPDMPQLVYELMQKGADGRITIQAHSDEIAALRAELRQARRLDVMRVLGASLLIGAVVAIGLAPGDASRWLGVSVLGWVLGGGSVLAFAGAWWKTR
ncbi:ubiquinone biosynthesis regulatory protein kinase UbiB [Acidihalobacter ferrooxydans]|uniref:Probable protein kinase UbiB n=1 Tax=Acidihalobacter ferrooxydans TaxID=1765967 RepID=A0A1P8UDU1_9GAMM|nr:ubiquinone biosynthesis regulatory protein kinase UbiB [Acidihalobacter ferrooxydans]APZ41934.1 ubiquinone biosynthesis regulatory protein kinase UbiB [Acidihalobacter ferrooxydans]